MLVARTMRRRSESGIYHVMLRGINRQLIFQDDVDRRTFLDCLAAAKEVSDAELFAYCLMGNHVHLLIRQTGEDVSVFVKRVAVRYVMRFNTRHERSGHLFQDRFRSEPVDDDAYLLMVVRYIWANPVTAGLVVSSADYPWSSRHLLGEGNTLVDEAALLALVPRFALESHETVSAGSVGVYLCDEVRPVGRPSRYTDEQVIELLSGIVKGTDTSALQRLEVAEQGEVARALLAERVSVRQVARVTGFSKHMVERFAQSQLA